MWDYTAQKNIKNGALSQHAVHYFGLKIILNSKMFLIKSGHGI